MKKTPLPTDRIRQFYVHATAHDMSDASDRPHLIEVRELQSEEFDLWLAEHDAQVAAAALDRLVTALTESVEVAQSGPQPNPIAWQTGALWTRDLARIHRDSYQSEDGEVLADSGDARAAIQRVREVHSPIDAVHYGDKAQTLTKVCAGCGTDAGNWAIWPCKTVRALDARK